MSGAKSLERLRVLDRLEVGPVRVEPRRIVVPHTVRARGAEHRTELSYRWEEEVFDPLRPEDVNLATVVGAQVALNYGLFCGEIAFRGPLDEADRRFLQRSAENTAREIYVNKLLAENPFLTGDARELPVERRESYLQARLVFDDPPPAAVPSTAWGASPTRHVVLSSGGKDSLLSAGLLREIGAEVHPVFVNESGRHWYTALNGYRHFRKTDPRTTRVWTNSDRVFSWMLRHLPFVRPDYGRIRADIYPVRLWTVAVFLFGALPLMRARGVGRLVIGDEYDTSTRVTRDGITHYEGLYDQSRWFDNQLTRYFHRKGWRVSQFSVLRQLSELLIEKILAERYPDLLRQQMSCHAAHLEGERACPCGRCEKCRRIVGMLVALGADPAECGYTNVQVTRCLEELRTMSVKQESAGADQLRAMLAARGVVPPSAKVREHPEILQVRVDPERSPLDGFPSDLRRPLLRIFLEHAHGAVRRRGRVWTTLDPLSDPVLLRPYRFEAPSAGAPALSSRGRSGAKRPYVLGELTWPEAQTRLKEVDLALLPVGALEQHGPHSPLDTDAFDAAWLAEQVAAACTDPKPLVLPLVAYGVSYHHEDFPGTISVSNETLARFVYEVGISAARNGVTKLVIVNGHGGNAPTLQFAAQMINRDAHIFACVDTGETSDPDVERIADTPNDVHAGEIETSTTLAIRPELVDMTRAKRFVPRFSSTYLEFSGKRSVEWYARTRRISTSGVLGDPTKASAEKGRKIWEIMIRNLVEMVEDLKRMTLDEIYEKRY